MNFYLKTVRVKGFLLATLFSTLAIGCKKDKSDEIEKTPYKGQTWTELADSFGEFNIIQPTLEQKIGIKIITNAVRGACIANGFDDAEGDGYLRLSFIERFPSAMKDTSKIILLVTGGNDWYYSVPIGSPTDTIRTSYYGALNYLANQVIKSNKKAIWVTMIQRNTVKHGGNLIGSVNYQDQKKYADAMLMVGAKYGIKVIDAFNNSGITYANASIYTTDGAHPATAAGQELYSNYIADEIL